MIDRASHAETRRLHRELRSPLPDGEVDVGVDHVDELRQLWDGLVAESTPVEPAVPPLPPAPPSSMASTDQVAPAWPAVAPQVRATPDGAVPVSDPLIVLPDARTAPVAPAPAVPPTVAPAEPPVSDEPAPERLSRRQRRAAEHVA
jgi:hypothetical protein